MSTRALLAFSILFSTFAGCNKEKNTFVRDPVTKVTGTLLIDGKPETMVAIRLNRVNGPDAKAGTSQALTSSGMTDESGKFVIGTYENGPSGDGAPPGEYTLTFQWGQINLLGGRYEGDKFQGKYADPAKSEHKVKVLDKPIDLGEIKLSSK